MLLRSRSQGDICLPDSSADKESSCSAGDIGDMDLSLGLGKSPGEGNDNLPEKFQGQRSLTEYNPADCKESDMTERRSTSQSDISANC